MKLKDIIKGFWLLLAAVALPSCSEEVETPTEGDNAPQEPEYYLSLKVNFNEDNNTRGATENNGNTSTDGENKGAGNESTLTSAHLFFFDATGDDDNIDSNPYVVQYFAHNLTIEPNSGTYSLIAKLEDWDLVRLAGKKLHLYVIGNMAVNIDYNNYKTEGAFLANTFTETTLGGTYARAFGEGIEGQSVPLNNYDIYIIDLSNITGSNDKEIKDLFKVLFTGTYTPSGGEPGKLWYSSSENEIRDSGGNLLYKGSGNLKLQRAVARVDYKAGEPGNIYPLNNGLNTNTKDEDKQTYLKIQSLKLFNVGKEAYLYRHTAAGTQKAAGDTRSYFGDENGGVADKYNWIVTPDWNSKKGVSLGNDLNGNENIVLPQGTDLYFNQPIVTGGKEKNEDGEFIYDWSVPGTEGYTTTAALDNWMTKNGQDGTDLASGYTPWYYVMENTVPKTEMMTLPFCTGIAFRMVVWDKVKDEPLMKLDDGSSLVITMGNGAGDKTGYYQEIEWSEEIKDDKNNVIEPAGYYLTYKYLIEHNNVKTGNVNGNSGNKSELAPMQIGIVRNNIYQIKVNSISSLPDPHEPDNITLSVEVKIWPWDKRYDDDITLF